MSEQFEVGFRDPHIGTLVRIDDVTPPAPPRQLDYIFEIVSYQVRVMLNEYTLETLSGWKEAGKENAFEQANEFCRNHNLTRDSQVEVRVVEEKCYRRMRPTKVRTYGPKFDQLNCGSAHDVPPDSAAIVWSSKKDL